MSAPVSSNTQRRLSVRVAEELARLKESDPEVSKLLSTYLTSLRFENARHRTQARRLQDALDEIRLETSRKDKVSVVEQEVA